MAITTNTICANSAMIIICTDCRNKKLFKMYGGVYKWTKNSMN